MAAEVEINGVAFQSVFPPPLPSGSALEAPGGASVRVDLKVTNHSGEPIRFSKYLSGFPELLTRVGSVVPFEYGANRYRAARDLDYPLLLQGQTLVIPLDGTMSYRGGQLNWKGIDGLLGFWRLTRSAAPYRFRLKYRQVEQSLSNIEGRPGTISGIWTGEAATSAVDLPLNLGD